MTLRRDTVPQLASVLAVCLVPVVLWAQTPTAAEPDAATPNNGATQADTYLKRLIDTLKADKSYKVRLQAAVFLGRSNDERVFEPLVAAMSNDEDYTVRAAAANALGNYGDPRAISHIIKRVATDTDPFVRDEALRALAEFNRDEALPYAIATFGSDDNVVRKCALLYLLEEPVPQIEQVLIRALGDTDDIFKVASDAVKKQPPADAMKLLDNALSHRDASVRRGAVAMLHAMATPEAAALILKVYERDIEADSVRNETRTALRELRQFLPVPQFIKDAKANPNKHERTKALKLLGVVGGDEAKAVLVAALDDEDVYVRGNAVMAMGELGDVAVVPALEKVEADPANQRIQHLVRHALKQLRKKTPSTN